jgi:hypothetical protein
VRRVCAHFFGGFRVTRRGVPLGEGSPRREKANQLLRWLLLNPLRPVAADELLDVFWPDQDPDRALAALHVTLHAVRRLLEPDRLNESGRTASAAVAAVLTASRTAAQRARTSPPHHRPGPAAGSHPLLGHVHHDRRHQLEMVTQRCPAARGTRAGQAVRARFVPTHPVSTPRSCPGCAYGMAAPTAAPRAEAKRRRPQRVTARSGVW